MLPPADEITYFIETLQTGSVSRAAERLGLSQPALSQALKRFEERLGTQLLIRSKSGVQPTQAGKQLALRARGLLRDWDMLRTEALRSSQEITGRFTLGCHVSVARYTLTHFLPQLLAKHPLLEIRLEHDLSRRISERVISCEIDFGIVVNPVGHPDLVITELCRDEVSVWSANGRLQSPLLFDPELHQAHHVIQKLQSQGHRFERSLHSSSLELLAELASEGLGSAVLPTRVARKAGLRSAGAQMPSFRDRICLIYRADTRGSRAQKRVTQSILEAAKRLRRPA